MLYTHTKMCTGPGLPPALQTGSDQRINYVMTACCATQTMTAVWRYHKGTAAGAVVCIDRCNNTSEVHYDRHQQVL